jgi:multidrug efflux pump subunit AcrA (membrane-fusion protein)
VRLFYSFAMSVGLLCAQSTDMSELKRMEVERLRVMAETGSVPRARLEQAQAELADAEDNAILRRTLYGALRIEDFTKEQSELMVAAATRLVDRQNERYERTKQLVSEGIVARAALTAMLEDLDYRKKALDLANFRAKLVEDLSEQAVAEGGLEETGPVMRMGRIIERYDGAGGFSGGGFPAHQFSVHAAVRQKLAGQRKGRYRPSSFARV